MKDFYKQREEGQGSYIDKELIVGDKVTFLRGMQGHQGNGLSSPDQVISGWLA